MVKNMTKIGGYNHQCDCMPRNVLQKNAFFGKIIQYTVCSKVRWHSSNTYFITLTSTRNPSLSVLLEVLPGELW